MDVVFCHPFVPRAPHCVTPPLHALFEGFFAPSSLPSLPLHPLGLGMSVRLYCCRNSSSFLLAAVRSVFLSTFSYSGVCSSWGFSQGRAPPFPPCLLSLFVQALRPSLQLGISLQEAASLESSFLAHSEALSLSMWLLYGLLALVLLQGFALEVDV